METAVEESVQVAKGVVDIIVAQGHEVGVHSLTFNKISLKSKGYDKILTNEFTDHYARCIKKINLLESLLVIIRIPCHDIYKIKLQMISIRRLNY